MWFQKRYTIRKPAGSLETHEVFLDTLAHQKEAEAGISEKKFEVGILPRPIYAILALFFLAALVLLAKTFWLQIPKGSTFLALADANRGAVDLISPDRGIIYDRNMQQLVSNAPAYELVCDKRKFIQSNAVTMREISAMASILGQNASDVVRGIAGSSGSDAVVAQNIPQQTLLVLETRASEFPDCAVQQNTVRDYAMGPMFSDVLGYLGRITKDQLSGLIGYTPDDLVGQAGLEESYESYLRGTPGRVETVRTATGIQKSDKVVTQPIPGDNLVLNIDAGLQQETYNALQASIKRIGAAKGAAIAMDPNTGAVLALVSYPSYDDNLFSGGISQQDYASLINDPNQPLFDRAIAGQYPTGSTIKPFEAAGALQEGIIDPKKLINDPGYILVHSQNDPSVTYRFGGVEPHGLVDMRKAIAVSSNIYFYTVGGGYGDQQGLGPARIKKYLDLFGWEQKTGIDLPGEFSGFVPTPGWKQQTQGQPWWDGDTYNLAIGQSWLQVSPLQVATAYCAIANGGTLYQPQVVQKILSPDGSLVKEFKPQIARQNFIDPQNIEVSREGMRDGVQQDYGSSHILNDLPVAAAGKTGTAEIGWPGHYNAWSVAFAPYDHPQIVFLATIEAVPGLISATLPVTHDVLNYYFTRK